MGTSFSPLSFFFPKSLAEALTRPTEIWMQPSLQNKVTASLRLIVNAGAAGCGGVGHRRRRRVTSDERFHNIRVSVPRSLAEACSPAVAAAAPMFVASPQREEKKKSKTVIGMMMIVDTYRYYHHQRQQGQQRGRSRSEAHVFFCLISKIQTERELRKHS